MCEGTPKYPRHSVVLFWILFIIINYEPPDTDQNDNTLNLFLSFKVICSHVFDICVLSVEISYYLLLFMYFNYLAYQLENRQR